MTSRRPPAGGVAAAGLAKWDGAAWSSVGSGNGPGAHILAVATDGKGHVYVGGLFRTIGNLIVNFFQAAEYTRGAAVSLLVAGFIAEAEAAPEALSCCRRLTANPVQAEG